MGTCQRKPWDCICARSDVSFRTSIWGQMQPLFSSCIRLVFFCTKTTPFSNESGVVISVQKFKGAILYTAQWNLSHRAVAHSWMNGNRATSLPPEKGKVVFSQLFHKDCQTTQRSKLIWQVQKTRSMSSVWSVGLGTKLRTNKYLFHINSVQINSSRFYLIQRIRNWWKQYPSEG